MKQREKQLHDALFLLIQVAREVRGQNTEDFMEYLQEEINKAMAVIPVRTHPIVEENHRRYVMEGAIRD
jgi:hypothetical protein